MPRDVPLHNDEITDEPPAARSASDTLASAAPAPHWRQASDVREAVLKREIARLTRDCNRLLAAARSVAIGAAETSPLPASDAATSERDAARLAAKDALVRALYASRSWRIAAPLRAVSRLLGRPPEPDIEAAIAETDAAAFETALEHPAVPELRDHYAVSSVRHRPQGHSRGEVLIVAPHLPLFDRQGGGLRLRTLIGMISELGWTITFCSTLDAEWAPQHLCDPDSRAAYEQALRAAGVKDFIYGTASLRAFLIESGGRMRYAFLSFPMVAGDVTPLIRSHCPWARVIFDTVDLHFLRMQREATLHGDRQLASNAACMQQLELACVRSADVTVAVSEDERRLLLDLVPEAVVETLPCVFEMPAVPPPGLAARAGLLFVGGFVHPPNEDAVLWFAEHVWPRIRAKAPGLVFRIVGADPTPEVLALGGVPGIEVLGFVSDLTPHLNAARVFVAPLRYGAGMKSKVAQSLVNGLPVVATGIGAEGMSLVDGEHLLIADAAEEFASCVLSLLNDDALWRRCQAQGRALVERTLSVAVVARRLETLFHV